MNSAVIRVAVLITGLTSCALGVPWPMDGINADDTSIGGNYYDFRGKTVRQFHHAVDVIAPAVGSSVKAVANGEVMWVVRKKTQTEVQRGQYFGAFQKHTNPYEHRLDVGDLEDKKRIWTYKHVTNLINPEKGRPWIYADPDVGIVGDGVNLGVVIGEVADPTSAFGWMTPAFAHVHLSRRKYEEYADGRPTYKKEDAIGIENPLELLDGYTDSHAPIIPGEHGTSEVKFRNNIQTGSEKKYFSKEYQPFWPLDGHYVISGQVDILANINDWTPSNWKGAAGPYKVGYQILREMGGGSTIPYAEVETFAADGQGTSTEAPTNDLVGVIYEKSSDDESVDSYGVAGEERFIYIVTNTDQDGTIEIQDTLGCWNTASISPGGLQNYPDGNYRVRIFAEDISGNPGEHITESKWLAVHNEGGTNAKAEVTLKTQTQGRQDTTLIVYRAEWESGELDVSVKELCKPQQNDSIFVDLWFSEPMYPESIVVQLLGEEPTPIFSVAELGWETEVFGDDHWRGYVPTVVWESMRNRLKGERRLRILAWDLAGAMLDTDPSTYAYWDTTSGEWVGFEDSTGTPSDSGGPDRNHSFQIAPFRDICLAVDASASMNLAGWEQSQLRVFQHLIDWMKTEEGGGENYRVAAWRFYSGEVEQIADYSDSLEMARARLGLAAPQFTSANEPGQPDPMNPGGAIAMTDIENSLLEAMGFAIGEYDDPRVLAMSSDYWHNLGSSLSEVETRYHWIAEQGPIFLLANEGALYGSECSEELREAARISGGGYFEGYGAASVESLYKAIPPVFESRGILAQVDGAGSDTVSIGVDSTMTRLDVIVSPSAWSGAAILREREEGKERSRGTYQLRDQGGSLVAPAYAGSGLYQWEVESPAVGDWQLEVSADPTEEYSVMARGGSPIELRLLSTGSIAQGATDTIEIKLEWEKLDNEVFELIDQNGSTEATLTLSEESIRVYSGEYTFSEAGHYRVRIRGDLGTQVVERETELCLNVRAAPTIELISPAPGETETAGTSYTIEWIDSCPERNASVTIGYDDDDVYSGTEEIIATVEEAGADTGQVVWEVFTAPEGTWYVWACIDDSLNSPVRVYGGTVTVTKGYQEGWPVTIGAQIEKNLCLSDLDNNGTVEVIVGAKDSLLYVLNHDGTNYGVNWPFDCHGMLTSGTAVGDVDGDSEKEIVVACSDTALVWVLSADGTVESGWPQSMRSGTWSAPLLVDLIGGDGTLEIVSVGYDSTLWAWDGFGTPLGGNWPVSLAHINQSSSPAGGDIDEDGENEVVVSSRYGASGAKIYAIEADGSIKWEYEVDYPVWTSPAIADVDRDGKVEILFTTFGFLTNTSRLFVLNGEDGSEASGWTGGRTIDKWAESSPAVGDLDQSGSPAIVIADGTGEVEAWNGSGTQLWNNTVSGYAIKSDPLIVDLTGDRSMECVVGANHRVYTLNAVTGDTISAYSRSTESDTRSVAVADLDGDGDLELVATVFSGVVYAWDLPGSTWADGQEWPQLQRDEAKTGEYRESASPVAPELLEAEFVSPDSMRVTWRTVDEDVYGRDELVRKYIVYRDDEPYGVDGSTLAGEVQAPDTSFTEQSAAVGDPNTSVFYRVRSEDMYENESAMSGSTVGEVDFSLGESLKEREDRRKAVER